MGITTYLSVIRDRYLLYLQIKIDPTTKLKLAFKCIFKKQEGDGDVSSFQALCTALSSTIGTGKIVGCLLYTSSQLVSLLVSPKKSVFGTWELKELVIFQV